MTENTPFLWYNFWLLIKGIRTFNVCSNKTPDFLRPLVWCDYPWGKQVTTTKSTLWSFLGNSCKFPCFWRHELYKRLLWHAKAGGVIVFKATCILGSIVSLFWKSGVFSLTLSFWWVTLNLMNFIYMESLQTASPFDAFTYY